MVLVILILIFVGMRKKKSEPEKKEEPNAPEKPENNGGEKAEEKMEQRKPSAEAKQPEGWNTRETPSYTERKKQPDLYVWFAAIGYKDIRFRLELEENVAVTVGRTDRAQRILNGTDRELAEVHCKIRYQNGRLQIWDAGTRNGTYVNGVRLEPSKGHYVENNGKIRMGSYEYRISIVGQAKQVK